MNNASDVGLYVTDNGVFTNNATGMVNISSASNYAIQIDANGNAANIVNNSTITITGGSNDGAMMRRRRPAAAPTRPKAANIATLQHVQQHVLQ